MVPHQGGRCWGRDDLIFQRTLPVQEPMKGSARVALQSGQRGDDLHGKARREKGGSRRIQQRNNLSKRLDGLLGSNDGENAVAVRGIDMRGIRMRTSPPPAVKRIQSRTAKITVPPAAFLRDWEIQPEHRPGINLPGSELQR